MKYVNSLLFATLFLLSATSALAQPTTRTRYVKPTASGMMDGTSWANAMTLQAALDGHMTGDNLYLMSGSYTPTAKKSDGMAVGMGEERDATYILPSGVTLYGGFAGTEASHTARNMSRIHSTYATTIEGDIGTMRTATETNNTDNIKRLFLLANNGTAILDGLTVARAHLDGSNNGGGLLGGTGANITLRQCRFIGNTANVGGAIWVDEGGTLTVTNSTFEGNSARVRGGAIFVDNRSTLTATGSTFRENTAGMNNNGSAVYIDSSNADRGRGTISRCSFFGNSNTGNRGSGAVYAAFTSTLHVSNSVFAGNIMGVGAAVYSTGDGTFINNTVYGNLVRSNIGAAMLLFTPASTWVVANNIIYGNTGSHQVFFEAATNKTMAHNLIQGNSINNPPSRMGMITPPMSASDIFAGTIPGSAGYLQLALGSPALHAGNNDYIDGDGSTGYIASQGTTLKDRAGNDRVFSTTVDAGAYELRATPRVRYVKPVATGMRDGSSWANAMTLQSALDGYMLGDFFYLMRGSYTPAAKDKDGMAITDSREASYALPDRIVLYGGFVGTETGADAAAVLAARGMTLLHSTNATTIEGDIGVLRTETDANNDDNVKQLFHLSAGRIATLDGLTVARAHNTATSAAADGTGLRAELGGSVTLRNCRFIGHRSRDGGAVLVKSNAANPGTLTVTDCAFEDNVANTGGALRIGAGGRLTVRDSEFEGNRATFANCCGGGAIMGVGNATLRVTNCTFERNNAVYNGGAIFVEAGGSLMTTGSTFRENTAGNNRAGSALYLASTADDATTGTISRCSFFENAATGTSNGTVYAGTGATLEVSSSVFVNNKMERGAGVYSDGSNGIFINNTVYDNRDRSSSSAAVSLQGASSTWVVANNIIYGNTATHQVSFESATNKAMARNIIQGNSIENGPTRTRMITAPASVSRIFLSTDPMHEDYLRLIPGNDVGVDAGANDYIDGDGSTAYTADQGTALKDRTGANRVNNTNVDVGAYEVESEVGSLFVADALGNYLQSSGGLNLLAAARSMVALRVFYAGADATMGVAITETDASGIISNLRPTSISSSRSGVTFMLAANTGVSRRTATLTFTLSGVTPAVRLVIPFTQRRGASLTTYVAADGSETASGADWANATTLQAALDNYISGDSLFLRAGVYTPTAKNSAGATVTDAREATYVLPDGIKIYGGFVGTETGADAAAVLAARESSRVHTTNATIIEGDIGTMRTETEANNDDNIKRLLYLGAGGTATLDGLTVARAFNSATGAAADGGGLRAESGSSVTLRNCRFIGHRSRDGGAVLVKSNAANPGTLTVTDCAFEDNEANTGGGIRIEAGGRLIVTDSEFEGNRATFANCCGGGALMGVGNATLTVTNCTFERNSSAHSGGAIYVEAGGTLMTTGSTFMENTAANNRTGSAILLASTADDATTGTISRCSFFENAATGTSNGTVYAGTGATLEVSSSVFVDNKMERGAGVYSDGSIGTFINNTVYSNRDRSSSSAAVSLQGASSTWVIANNIIYGNTGGHQLEFEAATNKTMAHNLIQGGDDGIENGPTRTGALTAPMFAAELFASLNATDASYLRLIPGNDIGVDAGNNTYIDGDVSVAYTAMQGTTIKDRIGANRVNNTTVDVGAYESAPSTAPFLRVLGTQGEILGASGRFYLPRTGGTEALRVVYGGTGASSVTIAETTDADNALTSVTPSVSSSPGEAELVFVANTTNSEKQVTLTFTLEGTTLDDVVITFIQHRAIRAVYVAPSSDGGDASATGLSWGTATTLQSALDSYHAEDLLYLKAGTYTPTVKDSEGATVTDAREATYVLPDGVSLYGGFAGTETGADLGAVLSARGMSLIHSTNATTIEGDIGTMRTEMEANDDDNVKRLLYLGAGDTATLDGLTVARAFNGGGLRAESGSNVTLRNCRFIGHRGHSGGAIFMEGDDANPATLTLTECIFEDNEANHGGAIRVDGSVMLAATGSTFERNRSTITSCCGGGAIISVGDATLMLTNCTFERNSARNYGGAIFVEPRGTLTTTGSTFRENTAENKRGSAVYISSTVANPSTGTIARCTFTGNHATDKSRGTVFVETGTRLDVSNSVFVNNRMTFGSALYSNLGHGTFINNTVYGNQDGSGVSSTAVRLLGIGSWVVANNIIYGNTGTNQVSFNSTMYKTMAHNLIQGNSINTAPTRTGMIAPPTSASRIFLSTDPMHEDYLRLIPGNDVGVDAGNNDYIDGNADAFEVADTMNLPDRAGDPRINNMAVDVGAYEAESEVGTVRVVDALGNTLQSSGRLNFLAAAEGMITFRVFYTGTGAGSVTIAETTDTDNIISALTTSVSSSPSDVTFMLAANTARSRRTATLTFTLSGVTPAVTLVIPLTQRRGMASTIYVTTSGSEAANGTSWADAMDLQTALAGGISGDVIYVGAGSYTPTSTTSSDPRDGVFELPSGVTLYGGFAGTETGADAAAVLAARETSLIHSTYATIIEGDIGTMRTETEANNGDNIKRLLYLGAGGTATLDGLTVARAFNSASGAAEDGGGLRAESGTNMTLRNCRFIGHRSHDGGAIVVKSTVASPATLMVTDCDFEDNEANTGGGIRVEAGGRLNATGSRFEGNDATFTGCCGGGAIMGVGNASFRVTNCTFERNSANYDGGAIYVSEGGTLTATGSTFRENTAADNRFGSAIRLNSSAANPSTGTISRCSFFENAATGTSTGTVYANTHSTLHVSNSVFAGNTIGTSAALYSEATTGTFINNTVYGNRDRTSGAGTSAVRIRGTASTWVVANNIIYGNTGSHQVHFEAATNKTMAHNLIQGNSIENGPTSRTGPLTAPMFATELFANLNATDANYLRLLQGIAAVNGGNNDYIDGDGSTTYTAGQGTALKDRTGANRVSNTTVDVGAFESAPSTAPFLRVVGTQGEVLSTSGRNLLPAAVGTSTLRVVYGGMGASSVTIAETTDADNVLTSVTPSVSSSPGDVELVLVANTTNREKQVTLTFTLEGATHDDVVLTFSQRRGAPVTFYVAADGSETASGVDWANATTLQAALDKRIFSRDSLFLKAGVYTPTAKNSAGATVNDARDATYVLPDGIKIYGGFAGTETEAAGREMSRIHSTNATIIEGDRGTMRTETDKNNGDNVKRLLYLGAGDTATLDGLTVARAFNSATGAAADGGGLRAESGSSVTLRNCRFIGHRSHDGGAIVVKSTEASPATLSVADCIFEDNEANTGGGVRIEAGGMLTVTNSEFEGNRATFANCCGGGALMGVGDATLRVTNCTFERNSARIDGGAILVEAGGTLTATGSTFRENTAGDAKSGSAVYLASSDANRSRGTISRCSFFENAAPGASLGTVYANNGATLHVSNSLFTGNSMGRGAAVYIYQGGGTFINNTVYGNASSEDMAGAVIMEGTGIWLAANNVIYGNAGVMGSQFELSFVNATGGKTMVHNLIEGDNIKDVATTRMGAITATATASEVFASTTASAADYLRLTSGSVGVNAGNNDYIDGEPDAYDAMADGGITDLLGRGRIRNRVVDVGAYEFYGRAIVFNPVTPADVTAAGAKVTLIVTFEGDATGFSVPASGEGAPASWLTVPPAVTVANGQNQLAITVVANTGTSERSSMIVFTPTGGEGEAFPTTLTITQLGARQSIVFDPATPADVASAGATVPVTVTFEGGATGFSVPASGEGAPANWLTVPPAVTMTDGQNQLAITVEENTGASERSSTIVFTPTGGAGTVTPTTLTLTQLGAVPRQSIVFAPAMPADVASAGATVPVTVTFEGGATGFSVPASGEGAPASWLTVPAAVTMAGGQNRLAITVEENMDAMARTSMIVFTPTGGAGTATPVTLTITQLGTAPRQTIVFDPATPADVAAAGATVPVTVTFEGGATGFSVPTSGEGAPASWLTVPPAVTMADGQNQLAITVEENMDAMARTSMIVFTPTGGAGTATPVTLTITQLGTAPRQTIVFDPATPTDVAAAGATVPVTVTFGGGATGFTVPSSGTGAPASWLTVPAAVTMAGGQNQLAITVLANMDAMARSSMIVFTPTGAPGTATPTTLTITQLGTAPRQTIAFDPATPADVASAGAKVTLTVTFGGGATGFSVPTSGENAPASWLTVPAAVTMTGGQNQLAITVTANTGASERSSMIVFTPTGGAGTATPATLTITQQGVVSFGVSKGVFAKVRVVNPALDELVIYGLAKEVGLLLRDVSGREVFSGSLPSGGQRVPLPPLARGVYVLVLREENGQTHHVRLLKE